MLNHWQLKDFDAGTLAAQGLAVASEESNWVSVTAPGDTHLALVAAGRLEHPFKGRHENDATWIADREWWWRTRFDAEPSTAGEQVELVFDGLDTFASIFLNGRMIGQANNMFRAWRFEIGRQLRSGASNELIVVFAPASASVELRELADWGPLSVPMRVNKRNLMRKAQFGWGWDWGPNLPTTGIWESVRIERWSKARLADVHARIVTLTADSCELRVYIDLEKFGSLNGVIAEVSVLDPENIEVANALMTLDQGCSATLTVCNPRLWWTSDLGEQPLYTVTVMMMDRGEVLDTQSRTIGLRTIELDQASDPDEPGATFFRFVLNGVPIFARGACWIPASSFVGAVDASHYLMLLEQALSANMNMIRVWGGGVYEHEAFYDLCDRLGLLVWQDFMFACAPYPDDEAAFVDNVRSEIRHQLKRLRHHPSLAVWCGNNECQVFQNIVDKFYNNKGSLPGAHLYDQVMPEAVAELDLTTPYWPGSPWGGALANSMKAGDVHDWTVWHGAATIPDDQWVGGMADRSPESVAYTRYAEDMGRFISEFGIHSAPPMSSLRRWMNADDLSLGSEGFLERIKDNPKDKVNAMLLSVTGLPGNLEEYVDFTMMLQAEGLKFGVEHFRRRKPHCSGTLIWQFNDCWPCVSWSLVDYDGVGKASFYAVTRVYAPVLASFKQLDDGAVELWITNDTLQSVSGDAVLELIRFAGGMDWNETVAFEVAANSSVAVWKGRVPAMTADRALCVRSDKATFAENRHFFGAIKDLQLVPAAKPGVSFAQVDANTIDVHLSAEAYLLFVSLECERAGPRFSDNYFDLRPGDARTIRVSDAQRAISSEDLTIRCWNQRLIH